MKWKPAGTILVLLFALATTAVAQEPFLSITSSYAEQSKDSYSETETISVNGNKVLYTVKYTGRRGPEQQDKHEECILSAAKVVANRKSIHDLRLNQTDSLADHTHFGRSINITSSITIKYINGNTTIKTKVAGNPATLVSKQLYKNSLTLLNQAKELLKKCL